MKALLHPFLLSSSPLRPFLPQEELAPSTWLFAVSAHPRSLNVLEFKFAGARPWVFPPARFCSTSEGVGGEVAFSHLHVFISLPLVGMEEYNNEKGKRQPKLARGTF